MIRKLRFCNNIQWVHPKSKDCKLKNYNPWDQEIKKGTWYLQIMKVRQVSECAWLDWCNLIGMQITTTYKIRTKYYENMRLNKHKESSKTNIGNHFFSQIVLFSNHHHCQIKTHSDSNKYFSYVIKMAMILINKIFIIIGAPVC
jgi:hypothetical protein